MLLFYLRPGVHNADIKAYKGTNALKEQLSYSQHQRRAQHLHFWSIKKPNTRKASPTDAHPLDICGVDIELTVSVNGS